MKKKIEIEEQLEGQMSIFDYPQCIPEDMVKPEIMKKVVVQSTDNVPHHSFPCDTCEKDGFPRKCNTDPLKDFCKEKTAKGKLESGYRGCEGCQWFDAKVNRCQWAILESERKRAEVNYTYPTCEGFGKFLPNPLKISGMCGNCRWANQFHYHTTDEKLSGYQLAKAKREIIEEPNIYCTRNDGSVNRRSDYEDLKWANFGACSWHRQHEFDTCDAYEPEKWWEK